MDDINKFPDKRFPMPKVNFGKFAQKKWNDLKDILWERGLLRSKLSLIDFELMCRHEEELNDLIKMRQKTNLKPKEKQNIDKAIRDSQQKLFNYYKEFKMTPDSRSKKI